MGTFPRFVNASHPREHIPDPLVTIFVWRIHSLHAHIWAETDFVLVGTARLYPRNVEYVRVEDLGITPEHGFLLTACSPARVAWAERHLIWITPNTFLLSCLTVAVLPRRAPLRMT